MNRQLSEEDRVQLARALMNILDSWNVAREHRPGLLGMPEKTRSRSLEGYRRGTPFPSDEEMLKRATYILAIDQALHTYFPTNKRMPSFWLGKRNRRLQGMSPLNLMMAHGQAGMQMVLSELDCTQKWI
jgi:hypothetical protein